jgi:2-methylaconitate cis-trans-isomerase PrpF
MKQHKENIDFLLEQNASEQLAKVDWQALNAAISSRLDQTSRTKTLTAGIPTALKIAAGLAAAAVILIAVMITVDTPDDLRLENGQRAVVRFAEPAGTASVEIEHALAKAKVFVDVGLARSTFAICDVHIIDVEGEREKNGTRAAWIIISRPEPVFADNGAAKDMKDLICMF